MNMFLNLKRSILLICSIAVFILSLSSCNSGSSTSTNLDGSSSGTSAIGSSTIEGYFQLTASSNRFNAQSQLSAQSGNTYQQSLNVIGAIANTTQIDVNFYSASACSGTILKTVTMLPGSGSSYAYPIGSYTTSSLGNYNLCSQYPGGCSAESLAVNSMRYVYNYTTTGYSPVESVALCVSNSANTPSGDNLRNWTTNTSCTSTTCGWSKAYSINLESIPRMVTAVVSTTGFMSGGTGQNTSSYYQVAAASNPATINVTYTNRESAITGFTTTVVNLPAGWIRTVNQCSNFNLSTNAACTDTYTLNSSTVGAVNIDFNTMVKVAWTNSSNNNAYTNQIVLPTNYTSGIVYVYVFNVTGIFSSSSTGSPVISSTNESTPSFYVVFKLNSANTLSSSLQFTQNNSGGSNSIASGTQCTITPGSTSCYIKLSSTPLNSVVGAPQPIPVTFYFNGNSGVNPTPTTSTLNFTFKYIAVTSSKYTGSAVGNAATANSKCNAQFPNTESVAVLGYTSPTTTITGLTANTTYYALSSGLLVGTTNANANFTGTLSNPISTTSTSVWTGINATTTPWSVSTSANCSNWTSASGSGVIGSSSTPIVSNAFGSSGSTFLCNSVLGGATAALYCVQP